MSQQLYTNNAATTLASAAGSGDTSLTVTNGAAFASPTGGDWQMVTLTSSTGTAVEIVKMTARAGNVLTVVRGQEGTASPARSTGDKVEARLTAAMLRVLATNLNTSGGLALGGYQEITSSDSVALGYQAAPNNFAVAVGYNTTAEGENSIAMGPGATAIPAKSVSIGLGGFDVARAYKSFQFASFAIPCVPRDDWWAGSGAQYNSGSEIVFTGPFIDLGTPPTWTTATAYDDGSVVRAVTPTGTQYRLWCEVTDSGDLLSITSGVSEPTWPAVGSSVAEGVNGFWLAVDPTTVIDEIIPTGMVFYPTEVGFICFNYGAVTAAPFVSIGTAASPTLFVNNQQLTGITGASQRQAFSGLKNGITDLRCTLVTAATGASPQFHGRFYAKGIFIQAQG